MRTFSLLLMKNLGRGRSEDIFFVTYEEFSRGRSEDIFFVTYEEFSRGRSEDIFIVMKKNLVGEK